MTFFQWALATIGASIWAAGGYAVLSDASFWLRDAGRSRSRSRYLAIDDVLRPGSTLVWISSTGEELTVDVSLARAAGWTPQSILDTVAEIEALPA